jgi:hypothetical protein
MGAANPDVNSHTFDQTGKCSNRSRRVSLENIQQAIEKHYQTVNYYLIDGLTIGAKNEDFALKEYWRVCEKSKIGKQQAVACL